VALLRVLAPQLQPEQPQAVLLRELLLPGQLLEEVPGQQVQVEAHLAYQYLLLLLLLPLPRPHPQL
jgi:hypothetical protein